MRFDIPVDENDTERYYTDEVSLSKQESEAVPLESFSQKSGCNFDWLTENNFDHSALENFHFSDINSRQNTIKIPKRSLSLETICQPDSKENNDISSIVQNTVQFINIKDNNTTFWSQKNLLNMLDEIDKNKNDQASQTNNSESKIIYGNL